ncbi:MAG: hypothetical protein AAGA70_02700 [Pseudomonadota bacterium]
MLNFLFRRRTASAEPEVKIETQRETFTRLVEEMNASLDKLADKPAVTIEPATGRISFALPEQFPDEALALPGPDEGEDAADAPEAPAEPGEKPQNAS